MFIIFAKKNNVMIIAILVEDELKMSIGACLSNASVFLIYDSVKKLKQIIGLPDCEQKEMKSKCYSEYLKEHFVEMVFAKDLGPKAKSYLDDLLIKYSSKLENDSVENIISYINKNRKR